MGRYTKGNSKDGFYLNCSTGGGTLWSWCDYKGYVYTLCEFVKKFNHDYPDQQLIETSDVLRSECDWPKKYKTIDDLVKSYSKEVQEIILSIIDIYDRDENGDYTSNEPDSDEMKDLLISLLKLKEKCPKSVRKWAKKYGFT